MARTKVEMSTEIALKTARRLARQEKRAKQRAANVDRAATMHKARLTGAADHFFIEKDGSKPLADIHIACSGWYYWDWKGKFYPSDLPGSQWFPYYCQAFDTVELNAPFYSWPTLATIRSWQRQIKDRTFVYTVKVCELITHTKRFQNTKTLVKDFGLIADMLGPHMGCFLFQLPPSYHYTATRLKQIIGSLDSQRRNVVEFRHKSWWNKVVTEAFKKNGIIFCSCSGPKLPDELVKTADDIYIRFHGTERWYRHNYSNSELDVWAKRIHESGAKRVWAYFNNDFDAYAIKNAQYLSERLTDLRKR